MSIDNTKHPINLLAIIQKPNETTRKFIERFNAECKIIDGLVDGVASLCLTNGLANDEFRKQLTTKLGHEQIHHPKDNHRETGSRGNPKPLKQKFDNYTPLAASITEIYHQISEKGVLPKARPLKGKTQNAKSRSLFCDYHQGYGHKTQDCYDLKDAIEQAIRDGKLNEFIKIIREPRTSDRERSPRPKSWNPRNHRDDDEPIMEIAVITGPAPQRNPSRPLRKI
ncbi:hypothetical protein PIB30_106231 [Stylosanthes scabra]|uniref:Reverse transcriptase domain-containing protein n=1 Tax=Stylosanthes scabra TaxID=79078 RepID=A0ABU6V1G3_9FABA|nr:hypothetical protein [Stylosanthes scabra]